MKVVPWSFALMQLGTENAQVKTSFALTAYYFSAEASEAGPPPDLLSLIPIRKTRAGLQFTCAAPTIGLNSHNLKDVWVCNSDGYVGQVSFILL